VLRLTYDYSRYWGTPAKPALTVEAAEALSCTGYKLLAVRGTASSCTGYTLPAVQGTTSSSAWKRRRHRYTRAWFCLG
jgi:hypothetical protein